jgi:hypothetical protein
MGWNKDSLLLLALLLVFAIWGWVHLSLSVRLMRTSARPSWQRILALVPPVAALVGWRDGRRVLPLLWWLLAAAYLVLRTAA